MAFKPQNTIAQFTDKLEDHGVAKWVYQHALIYFWDEDTQTGKFEWHYFGTPVQTPLPWADRYPTALAVEHPCTMFPPALNDLPEGEGGLYALALSAELNRLGI